MSLAIERSPSRVSSAGWAAYRLDALLVALLFLVAVAVRLPYFLLVPLYSDEWYEILWGLDIAFGRRLPLTAVDAYVGPFFAYLLAALFRILGLSPSLPRLTMVVGGALMVVAVYWLARAVGGRWAGLVAAALTTTCPFLVTYASHMAYSSCLTPLFMTLTLAALYVGVTRDRPWLLALGGLLAAVTLQTHPTGGVALVGIVVWFLARLNIGSWLRRPAPYLALALFGLGYAPMLIAHLRPGSPLLDQVEQRTYAFAPTTSPAEYVTRVLTLAKNVVYLAGGGLPPNTAVLWVAAAVIGALAVFGLLLAWRQGDRLLPLVFLSTLLLLPMVVKPSVLRYYLFLVPLAYVAVGLAVVRLVEVARTRLSDGPGRLHVARLGMGVGLALLTLYPLVTIDAYYRYVTAAGVTNAEYLRLAAEVRQLGACGDALFVEADPLDPTDPARLAQAFVLIGITYNLTLDTCAHTVLTTEEMLPRVADRAEPAWTIVAEVPGMTSVAQPHWQPLAAGAVPINAVQAVLRVYRVPGQREPAGRVP